MPTIPVTFTYLTGLNLDLFQNVRLSGSWDTGGLYSARWTSVPMQSQRAEDGCPSFTATVQLDSSQVNWIFHWGVLLDGPAGNNVWGIPTEVNAPYETERTVSFTLRPAGTSVQEERYYLTYGRRLGAQKFYLPGAAEPALRFSVWAPSANSVEVVFGIERNGYIDDAGGGADVSLPVAPLQRGDDGIWASDLGRSPHLYSFARLDHFPYMFRIGTDAGATVYRTDLYSRCQLGSGSFDPRGAPYAGGRLDLDGRVSCSVIVDTDVVSKRPETARIPIVTDDFIPATEFWRNEFDPNKPVPTRIEDLIIYELHIASVGFGKSGPGTFQDAIDFLDAHLLPLGVNAVEILPVAELGGQNGWGYGNTHHFALEFRSGGRDEFKHFVRACHQRGIAVILDVVYNHFYSNSERAEWAYDSSLPEHNAYYWYEGQSSEYSNPLNGYVSNGSTGWLPRFWEQNVRKMLITSAAVLLTEFHVDGFRVDLTQAIHSDSTLDANGSSVYSANAFGAKFLREWTRTLKLIRPSAFLIAEEHERRAWITTPTDTGGLGFDSTWYVDLCHNLVGVLHDNWASLITRAGLGGDDELNFDWFAGSLRWTGNRTVSYHISHDEAGNSGSGNADPDQRTHRTITQAAHGAPLVGATRDYAEARCRFAFGMAMLSAGTPMFLMAEEIGSQQDYFYNNYFKEDFTNERAGAGAQLFRFYQEMIAFRLNNIAVRSRELDVLYVHNQNRVIAFRRSHREEELLVFASLNNRPYSLGYRIYNARLVDRSWGEVFNSDASIYGGQNVGNAGGAIGSLNGFAEAVIPANGFVVFRGV